MDTEEAITLTEARRESGLLSIVTAVTHSSTARHVPYSERYQGSTAYYETPLEHLQHAADDEAARARRGAL